MVQGDQHRASRGEGETEPTEHERQVAIVAGWRALEAGLPEATCPYLRGDRRRDAWLASYRAAQALTAGESATPRKRLRGGALRTPRERAA